MSAIFPSPDDAEEALYEAIARADLEALMGVWSDDDEIVCIHPTGQRLSGHAAIRESWRAIFANNTRFRVHIKQCLRWNGVLHAVHSVVDTLYVDGNPTPHGPILSTNVYQRGARGWRLILRHTSAGTEGENDDETGSTQRHTVH